MDIAQSDKPILSVFSKKYATDQYGGYLGLSVIVYRVLSGRDLPPVSDVDIIRTGGSHGSAISLDDTGPA